MILLMALMLGAAQMPPVPVAGDDGTVRCGAVERPGIAERGDDGAWRGIAVDLCRRLARARQGGAEKFAFHPYRTQQDLRDSGQDALAILSAAELAVARPGTGAQAGSPVAVSRQVLLVRANRPVQNQDALAGQRICFIMATEAERALNVWARQAGIAIRRVGFQEPVELRDALDAGFCTAMAVDADDVPGGAANTRVLGPALAELPLFARTPRLEPGPN